MCVYKLHEYIYTNVTYDVFVYSTNNTCHSTATLGGWEREREKEQTEKDTKRQKKRKEMRERKRQHLENNAGSIQCTIV